MAGDKKRGKSKRSPSGDSRSGSDDEYEYYSYSSDEDSRSRSRSRGRDRKKSGKDRSRKGGRDRDRRKSGRGRDRRGKSRGRSGGGSRGGDWKDNMDEFIRKNNLDSRTEDALASLDKKTCMCIMGMDGGRNTFLLEGVRNPDAVVMSRIRNATRGGR
ncbi:unnamed protein product [Polarella glacialis]|uniref:Uncharacterized protein n=1 Tax=Polarella glacialis TaxID=89957 RepID=A0A813DAK1_POLGL|nr:unnamed protein product [Polarella glacialis]CAE8622703.1 unnamed protein product [Polarella glacialis]CAE8679028.1 unnamed protein product [Polarella glacialis]